MKLSHWTAAAILAGSPALAQAQTETQPRPDQITLEAGAGFDYSTGKYGDVTPTEVIYAPLLLKAHTDRWRVEAAIPYLNIKGPGGVSGGVGIVVPGAAGAVTSRSGLGDVSLTAGYSFLVADAKRPSLELSGSVKLPTARSSLGTGAADFTVQLSTLAPVTDKLSLTGSAGYEYLGDAPTTKLESGAIASAGVLYKIRDSMFLGLSANYRHRYISTLDDQFTLTPSFTIRSAKGWSLVSYGNVGLTNSTPDYEIGFQVTYQR